jgi:hypothetical protein
LDFDVGLNIGMQYPMGDQPLAVYSELFSLWAENFVAYYLMEIFEVTISTDT